MAAGCLSALDHLVERLVDDHVNLVRLHEGLVALGLDVSPADTNILFIDPRSVGREAAELRDALLVRGVRLSVVAGRLRALTHLDVDADGVEQALALIAAELGRT
jgi:threonine aldolase